MFGKKRLLQPHLKHPSSFKAPQLHNIHAIVSTVGVGVLWNDALTHMHATSVDEQSTKSSITRGSRKHYQTQLTLHKLEKTSETTEVQVVQIC